MRTVEDGATAATRQPISKILSAVRNTHFCGKKANARPARGWKATQVRRYALPSAGAGGQPAGRRAIRVYVHHPTSVSVLKSFAIVAVDVATCEESTDVSGVPSGQRRVFDAR